MTVRAFASRSALAAAAALAAGLGLMATNPGAADFEPFAADELVRVAVEEVCGNDGLPMLARLVVRDCPELIRSQRVLLGRLALLGSQRRNFGLFSLYRTDLGGQQVLPDWSIPRYRTLTLAVAGQFLVLPVGRIDPEEAQSEARSEARNGAQPEARSEAAEASRP